MSVRLGDYFCAVARRDIVFRVNKVNLRNSLGRVVDSGTRFIYCTGHPACGRFAKGLPAESIDDLPADLTGCPLVDTRAILR